MVSLVDPNSMHKNINAINYCIYKILTIEYKILCSQELFMIYFKWLYYPTCKFIHFSLPKLLPLFNSIILLFLRCLESIGYVDCGVWRV